MIRKLAYTLSVILILCSNLFAQVDGDYRTNVVSVVGSWSDAGIWERYDGLSGIWLPAVSSPAFTDNVITISTGDSVQLTDGTTFTIDQVVVASGASLIVFAVPLTQTVFLNDGDGVDILVNGRFYIASGGVVTTTNSARVTVNPNGYMEMRNGAVSGVSIDNYGHLAMNRFTINNSSVVHNHNLMVFFDATPVAPLAVSVDNATLINSDTFLIQTISNIVIQGQTGSNAVTNSASGVIIKTNNSGTFGTVNGGTGIAFTNAGRIEGYGPFVFNQTVGSFVNTGTISPGIGSNVSIMTAGNAILKPTGTVSFQIGNSNTPGTGYDQISISSAGTTTLAGTLTVTELSPTAPVGMYTLFTTSGTLAGSFSTVNKPTNYGSPVIVGNTLQIEKLLMALPIEWGSFTAFTINKKDVNLRWSTMQETNSSHFVIEESKDGRSFLPIGTVKAVGNSSVEVSYSFVHRNANTNGLNYYRVKQYDLDGTFSYSKIVLAAFPSETHHAVEMLANPARNTLKLRVLENGITVSIFQSNGIIVRTINVQEGLHSVNIDNLPRGVYHMAIYKGNRFLENKRFVIVD